jgi:hypothetical protein
MSNDRNKYQSRENRARIREVLLRDWDPIGVSNVPKANDEYDAYLDEIYVMLMHDRADAAAVEAYLWEIATNYMGISPADWLSERCSETASRLIGLRPQLETH